MSILVDNFRIDKKILQRILDFLPYPFLVAEFRNGIHTNIYLNQKFILEIGYTLSEILTIDDWFNKAYPDPHYRDEVMKSWGMLYQLAQRKRNNSVVMKALIHTLSKGDKWYEVKSSIFGRVQLVAFVDVHEAMSREKELSRLNENKNKTLSILSHDLRGPIASLHEISKLALGHNLTQEEFFTLVRNVNEKSFQMLEFLDTTLLWTKSNFDNISVCVDAVDVKKIINSIFSIYGDSFRFKNLAVTYTEQPDMKLLSDPAILTIVIRNLISNAIKFTPEGGSITITSQRQGEACIISVSDTGIGMTSGVLLEILSDNYTSRKGTQQEKGLGIGLKICRELLKKINGRLEIKSTPGQGTVMNVLL